MGNAFINKGKNQSETQTLQGKSEPIRELLGKQRHYNGFLSQPATRGSKQEL